MPDSLDLFDDVVIEFQFLEVLESLKIIDLGDIWKDEDA